MWDDHEVQNDFAGESVDRDLFDAGLRAFREYMPIGGDVEPERLYRTFRWGADADLILLDERSFRDDSAYAACRVDEDTDADPIPASAFDGAPDAIAGIRDFVGLPDELPEFCEGTINDDDRTLLGDEQKRFLFDWLKSSDATWKIVVNPVPIQELLFFPYDRWEGYAAERREVLEFIRDEGIDNVVFLTTDFHANIFGPVRMDAFEDDEPIAYEAVAGPIATTPLREDIEEVVGGTAADAVEGFLEGAVGVDCTDLDAYAYAVEELDAGRMSITSKDADGNELCSVALEAK
jgi:phosphodiesterase/alkaline phosphatase D-like protein